MSPLFGKMLFLFGLAIMIFIRVPYELSGAKIKVAKSKVGLLDKVLRGIFGVGILILPLVFVFSSALSFADYPLRARAFFAGGVLLAASIWFFFRSHADLGENFSMRLEIREGHRLVSDGVYAHVRHPMYSSAFLYSIAQALLLANWVAGPAAFMSFSLLYVLRVKEEEKMMLETFGTEYQEYMSRTKRIIPFIY